MSDKPNINFPEEIIKLLDFTQFVLKRMVSAKSPELQAQYRKLLGALGEVLHAEAVDWNPIDAEQLEQLQQMQKKVMGFTDE